MEANDALTATLRKIASSFASPVSDLQISQMLRYIHLLFHWNRSINLTASPSAQHLAADHIPDSFAMAAILPPNQRILDIGSGAGLPAIPFAILRPDCAVTLVEPRAKRTAFLSAALRELNLSNLCVQRSRLEDLPPTNGVVFSSKATFDPSTWLTRALDCSGTEGGILVFIKDPTQLTVPDHVQKLRALRYAQENGQTRWLFLFQKTLPK